MTVLRWGRCRGSRKHTPRACGSCARHHQLAAERGLAPDLALDLARSERLALAAVRHVIVTSNATQHALRKLESSPTGVRRGARNDAAPLARRVRGETLKILCVATLIPRKGHDLLVNALAALRPLRWHLTCIGSLTATRNGRKLRAQLQRLDSKAGDVRRRVAPLNSVGSMATRPVRTATHFEAMAWSSRRRWRRTAVISTRVGAIADLVGTAAGLLVAPGDGDCCRRH